MTSRRRWLAATLGVAVVATAGLHPVGAQPTPDRLDITITDGADLPETGEFRWYVTVTDTEGRPVKGLEPSAFQLFERPGLRPTRPVTRFVVSTLAEEQARANGTPEAGPPPMSIVLAIDRSSSLRGSFAQVKQAATDFVDSRPPADEIAVFAFGDSVDRVHEFTTARQALKDRIATMTAGGTTALYEAIYQAATTVRDRGERRAFVVITDGQNDTALARTKDEAIRAAVDSGAPGYMLGFGSTLDSVLGEVADQTGGRYRKRPATDDIRSLFSDLSDLLDYQYTLTYTPDVRADDGRYTFEVRVESTAGKGSDTAGIWEHRVTVGPDDAETSTADATGGPDDTVTPTADETGDAGAEEGAGGLALLLTAALLALLALAVGVAWWRRRDGRALLTSTPVDDDTGSVPPTIGDYAEWPEVTEPPTPLPTRPGADTRIEDDVPPTVFLDDSMETGAWLEVAWGDEVGRRISLAPDERRAVSVGRHEGSTIQVRDPSVSRKHVVIRWRDGAFHIFNLSDRNPALVNGQAAGNRLLRDGDRITLGRVELVFRHPGRHGA